MSLVGELAQGKRHSLSWGGFFLVFLLTSDPLLVGQMDGEIHGAAGKCGNQRQMSTESSARKKLQE